MTRNMEVFYLPLLFLTVALLGGLRVGDRVIFLAPPLSALVLGMLLVGVLVRSGALAPERLMNAGRTALANVNGFVVLITMYAAGIQAFNVSIPEWGLPRVLFTVFLFVLLLNTLAAAPDRVRVLRSAVVIFGSAFILKFIVLAALSDPEGGRMKRVLLVLLEGLTLGTLSQQRFQPVTGYVAFITLALFVGGLALLPARRSAAARPSLPPEPDRRRLPE